MKILYISNFEKKESSGIFNKILDQVKAFSINNTVDFIYKDCNTIVHETYTNSSSTMKQVKFKSDNIKQKHLHKIGLQAAKIGNYNFLYFRNQFLTTHLLRLLVWSKTHKVKIAIEVPTYPYIKEQITLRSNVFKKIAFILMDFVSFNLLYLFANKMFVVKCSSEADMKSKMTEIFNGYSKANIEYTSLHRKKDSSIFTMIAVGWIHEYHGFDRIIEGIYKYKNEHGKNDVLFYIIGDGNYLPVLQKMVKNYSLENEVIFTGKKDKSDLVAYYEKANLSIGTLKLYKRFADIETSLKAIESFALKIPIVTSGDTPQFSRNQHLVIRVSNDDSVINISYLRDIVDEINKKVNNIDNEIFNQLTWENITSEIIREIQGKYK